MNVVSAMIVVGGSGIPNGKVGDVLSPLPSDVPKFARTGLIVEGVDVAVAVRVRWQVDARLTA